MPETPQPHQRENPKVDSEVKKELNLKDFLREKLRILDEEMEHPGSHTAECAEYEDLNGAHTFYDTLLERLDFDFDLSGKDTELLEDVATSIPSKIPEGGDPTHIIMKALPVIQEFRTQAMYRDLKKLMSAVKHA